MTTNHHRPEASQRGARMLRTALGPAIARFLEDPAVVEVMLNPDGRLWIDRLSEGLSDTGERLSAADGERIVRLVAHHVGAEVHARAPRVSAELPETGERFEGLLPPVVAAPAFAIRKPAVAVFTLGDYVAAGIMSADQAETLRASACASGWSASPSGSSVTSRPYGRRSATRYSSKSGGGICASPRTFRREGAAMMNLAEYRRTASRLADFLPWAALVGPGVVLNKDGSFQRTAKFRGPDLDSAVAAELVAVAGRINNAFRRLGSGWAIFVEAQRSEAATYPDSEFPDPASGLLDAERKAAFEEAGTHFESGYFLTILYLPPAEDAARAETWLYEGRERSGIDTREVMRGFVDRTDRVLALLDGFMPECRWIDDAETLTYLHSTVSTNRHRVGVPETPIHLDALLADQPLTGGLEPRLGDQHLRVLTVTGFPTATTPGLLDDLNRLAFPYRWSTRAILLDKTDATKLLTKIRRQWFAKRKSIAAILKEVMTNEASALIDTDASNKAADADMALQELGADVAGMAYVTATITVWDADPRIADEKLRLAEKVVQGRDFTAMVETVNAVDAWLGSLPGHAYANVWQPPVSTLNLAHMIPLSAVWAGPERDEHFGAPPLLYGKTEGSTPFRLSLHVGDVGHTLVVGPTGAGKSVLLALMALQFRRYDRAQVFAFDFGGSIRAASLAMGGDWHDLGGGLTEGSDASVSLQPLARIDDTYERAWAADWIVAILMREGVPITPEVKEHIWTALSSLASAPVTERTITGLAVLLQSNDLKQALRPYCVGGPYGRLLDAESEHLGSAAVQAFEIEGLVGTGAAPAVLSYLFHRIGDRLDVLQAARTLQQVNQQITSLQNEAQMLVNQARNLASLPISSLQQIQQSVQKTQALLNQAQNIAYDVKQIDQVFQQKYGNVSLSASDQQLVSDARSRWQNTVGGLQDAMKVQATVVGNIDTNRTQMSRLVGASQGATGALQATQAGNQLLALQAQQLADLTAVVAANGRAQALTEAERAAAAEQGREQRRRFLTPGTGYQPGSAQMFNDGN